MNVNQIEIEEQETSNQQNETEQLEMMKIELNQKTEELKERNQEIQTLLDEVGNLREERIKQNAVLKDTKEQVEEYIFYKSKYTASEQRSEQLMELAKESYKLIHLYNKVIWFSTIIIIPWMMTVVGLNKHHLQQVKEFVDSIVQGVVSMNVFVLHLFTEDIEKLYLILIIIHALLIALMFIQLKKWRMKHKVELEDIVGKLKKDEFRKSSLIISIVISEFIMIVLMDGLFFIPMNSVSKFIYALIFTMTIIYDPYIRQFLSIFKMFRKLKY